MKWILCGCLSLAPFFVMAKKTNHSLELIFNVMNQCYDETKQVEVQFIKCATRELNKYDNPDFYRVKIEKNQSGNYTLFIHNQKGEFYNCGFKAASQLTFYDCRGEKKKPLDQMELINVDHPELE